MSTPLLDRLAEDVRRMDYLLHQWDDHRRRLCAERRQALEASAQIVGAAIAFMRYRDSKQSGDELFRDGLKAQLYQRWGQMPAAAVNESIELSKLRCRHDGCLSFRDSRDADLCRPCALQHKKESRRAKVEVRRPTELVDPPLRRPPPLAFSHQPWKHWRPSATAPPSQPVVETEGEKVTAASARILESNAEEQSRALVRWNYRCLNESPRRSRRYEGYSRYQMGAFA